MDGVLVTSWLREQDFADAGADSSHAEGIIDTLRTVQGATLAVLARERDQGRSAETKVSLRSTDGRVDVAAVAALKGGGGHKQAAGFTAAGDVFEVLQWTEQQLQERCDRSRSRLPGVRPRGSCWWTSPPAPPVSTWSGRRAAARGAGGPLRHSRPLRHRPASVMTGSATRVSSLLMGLPKEYDLLVQFGAVSSTGDPPA